MKSIKVTNQKGKWYVSANKNQYFTNTESQTKEEAEEKALIRIVQEYKALSIKAFEKLVKRYPNKYNPYYSCDSNSNTITNYSDLFC